MPFVYLAPMTSNRRLTLGTLSALSGLPRQVLRAEIDKGELPALVVSSGRRYVAQEDFARWLLSKQVVPDSVSNSLPEVH